MAKKSIGAQQYAGVIFGAIVCFLLATIWLFKFPDHTAIETISILAYGFWFLYFLNMIAFKVKL